MGRGEGEGKEEEEVKEGKEGLVVGLEEEAGVLHLALVLLLETPSGVRARVQVQVLLHYSVRVVEQRPLECCQKLATFGLWSNA